MLNVDGWTDGRTDERTDERTNGRKLCLPAKAGATITTTPMYSSFQIYSTTAMKLVFYDLVLEGFSVCSNNEPRMSLTVFKLIYM